jgi:hypothetical protein
LSGNSYKYSRLDDLSTRLSSKDITPEDNVELSELVRAISSAVTALADTLNALGLRIALARNTFGPEEDGYPGYYNRLARLSESAAGQVRGIQQLLATIDDSKTGDQYRR